MISYLGSLVQCCGEGGALQTDIIVLCAEHSPCSGHTGFAPYRGVCAFPVYTAQAPGCSIWSGPCLECSSSFRVLHESADSVVPACCVFPSLSGPGSQRLARPLPVCGVPFPSVASGSGSQRRGHPLPVCGTPFPSAAPACAAGNRRPVCRVGGGGFSGAEFAPFPSPCLLPPAGMGRLLSEVSQSLCFVNCRRCVPAG